MIVMSRLACPYVLVLVLLSAALASTNTVALAAGDPEEARAVQLFEGRKYDGAKAAFESILKKNPRSPGAAFYLGRSAMMRQDFDEAVRLLEKAAGIEGTSSVYHMWLGRAYAQKGMRASILKRPFLARSVHKEFEKAVELDPANLDARNDLVQFYMVAPGIMGGSADKARAQAEEIAKRDAVKGHQTRAYIYQEEKNPSGAEHELLAAVQEHPENRDARFALGLFHQQQKNYDKAFEVFEAMAKMDPPEARAYYQIGRTGLLSGKNMERAEECFKIYLQGEPKEGQPSHAWAHVRLGMLYEKKGSRDLAKKEYEAALRLEPDHKEAREALKKIS